MKKTMILPLCCLLWHLAAPAWAQETLSLKECREMALKYNKEMAASVKQTESARYTARSYKGNFFPNFTAGGTGLYSNADGSYGIAGGNLPVFLPDEVKKANKLLKFTIDDGSGNDRTIVSGIAKFYQPEELIGKDVLFIANLAPRKLMGIESQGMILSAENFDGNLSVTTILRDVKPGSCVC